MTYARRIRFPQQVQTSETNTALVAAPDGTGGVHFRAESGGGGGCDHQHVTDTFTAAGDTPEAFTLSQTPLWARRVYVNGLRAWPDDVGGSGDSVEVNTAADDQVVVDYEAECSSGDGPTGDLVFPGTEVTHGDFASEHGSFVATAPGWLAVTVTADIVNGGMSANPLNLVDAAGNSSSETDGRGFGYGVYGPGLQNMTAGNTYYFPIEFAGTWYIVGDWMTAYDAGDTGAASFAVHYPTGSPTGSLDIPGSSLALDIDGNQIGTFTDGPCILVVVMDTDLSTGKYLGYVATSFGDGGYSYNDIAAGTYVFVVASSDTWLVFATDFGGYDAGLMGSGTYQVIPL